MSLKTPSRTIQPVTIKDVAAAAGVSPSTVSKVLTANDYSASARTTQKVREAAARLGYVPDSSARNLRNRRSGQIGIVLNELDSSGRSMALQISGLQMSSLEIVQISFDGAILAGLTQAIRRHKQGSFVIYPQPGNPEDDDPSRYMDRRVEGLIIRTDPRTPNRLLKELDPSRVPMVALWTQNVPPGVGYADVDHKGGGKMAVRHLLELGHRRIAFYGNAQTILNAHFALRHQGYLEALGEAGLHPGEAAQVRDIHHLRALMTEPDPVTAVFAPTDLQAAVLAQDLINLKLRIPEDISLVGFDDIFGSDFIAGGLTTLYHPVREMAEMAVDNLMAMIRGETIAKCRTLIPTRMIVRASTKPLE
jgi:DNA-binding LacI/PurR family transcriptional regulator